jgi:hypothetical protein
MGERWAIQQHLKDKAKRYREKTSQGTSSDREFYLEIATLLETICTEIGNAEHWR